MQTTYHVANALSVALFLYYGLLCLFAGSMVEEFERFGLSRFRRLTGGLEVLGALGLIAGYFLPYLTTLSAAGLALLMLAGLGTRIRVKDPVGELLPAAFLLVVNAFIALSASGFWSTPS